MRIPQKNLMFSTVDAVNQICKPLFENTFIDYVDYAKIKFVNSTYYGVHNNNALFKNYIEGGLYPTYNELMLQSNRYALLSNNIELPIGVVDKHKFYNNIKLATDCNIPHRLYILNSVENGLEFYGFGTSIKDNRVIEYFINNIDVFEKFIEYFHLKGDSLIKDVKQDSLVLPNFKIDLPNNHPSALYFNKKQLLEELQQYSATYLKFDRKLGLTKRECEILEQVASGLSSKEIAKEFKVSFKTVEVHIHNIKQKADCHFKHELRDLWNKAKLI